MATRPGARLAGLLLSLALAGCGRPPAPTPSQPPPKPAVTHQIAETTIRFADPKGRWTFSLEADRVEAATIHGPYDMAPARGRYEEKGRAPVTLSADRAHVDEAARRVVLEGNAKISSPAWGMQADRVDYDLRTGEVVATGRTKWVFTEGPPAAQSPSAPKDTRP
jgi:Lipopolysaccharide-assembly, LptC-related